MRRSILLFSNCISLPSIICIYFYVATIIVMRSSGWDVLYGLPRSNSPGELNLRIVAGWLFIIFFPHIINGMILSRVGLISVFLRIRTRNSMCYYRLKYKLCIVNTLLWSVILIGIHSLKSTSQLLIILLVFLTHMVMWTLVMIVFDVVLHETSLSITIAPTICISFISMAERVPSIAHLFPSFYGMISRSSLFYEKGYSPYVLALLNTSVSMLCIFLIYLLLKIGRRRLWMQ